MAVGSSTASDPEQSGAQAPIRTCIGCRQRAAAAELLRVVAAGSTENLVVPDPRHRAAGRGAWVHRDAGCVALAERRRAFARALRVPGPIDPTPVREYVGGYAGDTEHIGDPTSGTPQE